MICALAFPILIPYPEFLLTPTNRVPLHYFFYKHPFLGMRLIVFKKKFHFQAEICLGMCLIRVR